MRLRFREHGGTQLFARPHLELVIHVAEVVLDGLRAEVEPSRGLARRRSLGERHRHLELLRGELLPVAIVPHARALAARLKLGKGALGPRRSAELVERLQCLTQVLARVDPTPASPQPLPVVELGARLLEYVGGGGVMTKRLLVLSGVVVARELAAGARGA